MTIQKYPNSSSDFAESSSESPEQVDATESVQDECCFVRSAAMDEVLSIVAQVATTDATVLIQGESGVGKGIIAKLIHEQSLRKSKPFIKINCAALPGELLESELFGYEKGAFTGAHRRKPGRFEFAQHGTIFLDEIGELSLPLQAKLLQVLQDGEFTPLGGEKDIKVDVRIITSTNRDLEEAAEAGRFRKDLFYRLDVVKITGPPLRERKEEIPFLINFFLQKYSKQYNRPAHPISADIMSFFLHYLWPGNVRELENIIKRIVILENEDFIRKELPFHNSNGNTHEKVDNSTTSIGLKQVARKAAGEAERFAIQNALDQTHWNRVQAAKLLKISYKTLLYKMQHCGLSTSKEHRTDNGQRISNH